MTSDSTRAYFAYKVQVAVRGFVCMRTNFSHMRTNPHTCKRKKNNNKTNKKKNNFSVVAVLEPPSLTRLKPIFLEGFSHSLLYGYQLTRTPLTRTVFRLPWEFELAGFCSLKSLHFLVVSNLVVSLRFEMCLQAVLPF